MKEKVIDTEEISVTTHTGIKRGRRIESDIGGSASASDAYLGAAAGASAVSSSSSRIANRGGTRSSKNIQRWERFASNLLQKRTTNTSKSIRASNTPRVVSPDIKNPSVSK